MSAPDANQEHVPDATSLPEDFRSLAPAERHALMDKLAAEAMADPAFVADMRETMHAFRFVDQENWPEPLEAEPNVP